ncbi:multidrug effflux MFS transporter [Pseudoalteromonas shioyasakiensis]|uniref:multidrug effflux MFS transporter n=1 Tax=Pseudoalteromonas shioyasakiensis TaxID=1190813 RepID=UPI0021187B49|nr:multidrug effflux MFS transporter [Pseudoalteromonas shioyasakiensis]MCQ8882291.1 multidrug effflux MFS transporter [Pseudoalteromonas shioyasakiensis]
MQSRQHKNLSLLFILGLLVVFCPLGIDIYLPAFPTIAEQLNASEKQLQQTVAIFLLTVGLGQLIAGPLADKFGRKPVAISGVTIYGLAAFWAYLAPDFTTLMIARALQGLGACATFVVAFSIVRDKFGSERSGQIITYLNGIVCFIPALAPILGAWLTVQFGWRMNFLFMVSFAVVGLFIVLFLYKETRPKDSFYSGHILDLRRFIPIISTPLFLFHSLICLVTMSAILVFVTLAPGWIITELGGSVTDFTFWFTCNAALSIFASFVMPIYIKRQPKRALKAGLMLLVLSGCIMLAFSQQNSVLALMFPMFLAAFGYALTLGSSAGRALSMFPKQAGTASALIGLMQMSGASLLVFITQFLNLTTPVLIGVHFLMLTPFTYLLLKHKRLS